MTKTNHNQRVAGKIKKSILVISSFIVVFFIFIMWVNNQKAPVITPIENSDTSSSTAPDLTGSTDVSTPVTATSTKGNQNTPINALTRSQPAGSIGRAAGIAAGGGLSKMSTDEINRELDDMVRLGITWVRFDIEWGDVQYDSPNKSTWSKYDAFANAVVAHHMHALGILLFTPEWARTPGCGGGAKCPPRDPAQFATFAAQVVSRYKSKGMHYWEIWNEPNNYDFWATKTDCNAYTALLKATYPAMVAADPQAFIVTGGLAPETTDKNNISQTDFLTCVYKAGGKNYFDAVGDHSYTFPKLPSSSSANSWGQMSQSSPSLRSIMIANGDANKKIWITEFGAPTNGPDPYWYVSEQGQADTATDAMRLYKTYDWAGPIFWYTLKDGGTTTDTIENFFGLTRADGSIKPAYLTLQNIFSNGL